VNNGAALKKSIRGGFLCLQDLHFAENKKPPMRWSEVEKSGNPDVAPHIYLIFIFIKALIYRCLNYYRGSLIGWHLIWL
jgi:hypothetical protein